MEKVNLEVRNQLRSLDKLNQDFSKLNTSFTRISGLKVTLVSSIIKTTKCAKFIDFVRVLLGWDFLVRKEKKEVLAQLD